MKTNPALNLLQPIDPRFREMRIGEFGYFLADLDSKTIHISNMVVEDYPPAILRITTADFGEFCFKAPSIFKGDELLKVVEIALNVFNGLFDGTY